MTKMTRKDFIMIGNFCKLVLANLESFYIFTKNKDFIICRKKIINDIQSYLIPKLKEANEQFNTEKFIKFIEDKK